jgi:hypothetical protein
MSPTHIEHIEQMLADTSRGEDIVIYVVGAALMSLALWAIGWVIRGILVRRKRGNSPPR